MTPTNATSDVPATRSTGEEPSPAEGRSWPEYPWDGLSDEQGPIPAFGPVVTDKNGRIVPMSQEERAARSDAVRRMLAVIRNITDETDTDEVWDEFSRAMGESS